MKWLTILIFFFNFNLKSQNLIPNPSFELMDSCSIANDSYIFTSARTLNYYCSNWFDNYSVHYSTSDLISICLHSDFEMPDNKFGYSYPFEGQKYASFGLVGFNSINTSFEFGREHMSILLSESLTKDSAYCVSFYYKNSNYKQKNYALDNIGVLFTYDSLRTDTVTLRKADVRTEKGVFLNNSEWELFSGYYIAKGGEKYFNLGLFGNQSETQFDIPINGDIAFVYFIDNISVTQCNKDSIFNVYFEMNANVFTPNNDNINDTYTIKHQNITELNVYIYNRWGNLVRQYDGLIDVWEGNNNSGKPLSDGVYFIVATAIDKYGETHQKSKTVTLIR